MVSLGETEECNEEENEREEDQEANLEITKIDIPPLQPQEKGMNILKEQSLFDKYIHKEWFPNVADFDPSNIVQLLIEKLYNAKPVEIKEILLCILEIYKAFALDEETFEKLLSALYELLDHNLGPVRHYAVKTLCALGINRKEVLLRLISKLDDPVKDVREQVKIALKEMAGIVDEETLVATLVNHGELREASYSDDKKIYEVFGSMTLSKKKSTRKNLVNMYSLLPNKSSNPTAWCQLKKEMEKKDMHLVVENFSGNENSSRSRKKKMAQNILKDWKGFATKKTFSRPVPKALGYSDIDKHKISDENNKDLPTEQFEHSISDYIFNDDSLESVKAILPGSECVDNEDVSISTKTEFDLIEKSVLDSENKWKQKDKELDNSINMLDSTEQIGYGNKDVIKAVDSLKINEVPEMKIEKHQPNFIESQYKQNDLQDITNRNLLQSDSINKERKNDIEKNVKVPEMKIGKHQPNFIKSQYKQNDLQDTSIRNLTQSNNIIKERKNSIESNVQNTFDLERKRQNKNKLLNQKSYYTEKKKVPEDIVRAKNQGKYFTGKEQKALDQIPLAPVKERQNKNELLNQKSYYTKKKEKQEDIVQSSNQGEYFTGKEQIALAPDIKQYTGIKYIDRNSLEINDVQSSGHEKHIDSSEKKTQDPITRQQVARQRSIETNKEIKKVRNMILSAAIQVLRTKRLNDADLQNPKCNVVDEINKLMKVFQQKSHMEGLSFDDIIKKIESIHKDMSVVQKDDSFYSQSNSDYNQLQEKDLVNGVKGERIVQGLSFQNLKDKTRYLFKIRSIPERVGSVTVNQENGISQYGLMKVHWTTLTSLYDMNSKKRRLLTEEKKRIRNSEKEMKLEKHNSLVSPNQYRNMVLSDRLTNTPTFEKSPLNKHRVLPIIKDYSIDCESDVT